MSIANWAPKAAAVSGHTELISLLHREGADVNLKDEEGRLVLTLTDCPIIYPHGSFLFFFRKKK